MEAWAEKVRAAYTREQARDFYDLALLARTGADLSSAEFVDLVDQKLAELRHPPMTSGEAPFGLTRERRIALEASVRRDLAAVVRLGESPLELDDVIQTFARLWAGRLRRT